MNLHFVTVVSGERSARLFLDVTLPGQLTSGNLLAFAGSPDVSYKVYSTPESPERITNAPPFKELNRIIPATVCAPRFGPSEDFDDRCRKEAVNEALDKEAALIFAGSDIVWSEGAFKKLDELCHSGAHKVALITPELDEKTFVPAFMTYLKNSDKQAPASCRKLTRLALDHLHVAAKNAIVNNGGFSADNTDSLYWRVGSDGFVARCMRWRTVMLRKDALSTQTGAPTDSSMHVVTDTDEIAAFRIAQSQKPYQEPARRRFSPLRLAERLHAEADTTAGNRLQTAVRIHAGDISDEWMAMEERSGKSISKALSIARIMNEFPKPMDHVKRVAVFGTGSGGMAAARLADRCGWEVACYIDNKSSMWGKHISGRPVKGPEALSKRDYELIVVSSVPGKDAIFEQLTGMGLKYQDNFIYFLDTVRVDGLEIRIGVTPESLV